MRETIGNLLIYAGIAILFSVVVIAIVFCNIWIWTQVFQNKDLVTLVAALGVNAMTIIVFGAILLSETNGGSSY